MPSDHQREFLEYSKRFERIVGSMKVGQYGRFRNRLIRRMNTVEFELLLTRYMALGDRFNEMVSSGDTIDENITLDLRASEIELVLERSLFLPRRRRN